MNNLPTTWAEFGQFRLELVQRILWRGSEVISLAPKEVETLIVLVENGGRLIEKDELISRVWPDTFVGDGSLARNISVLRKTLGDGFIQTLPRRGYRFTAPVQLRTSPRNGQPQANVTVADGPPVPPASSSQTDPASNDKEHSRVTYLLEKPGKWRAAGVALLAVATLLFVGSLSLPRLRPKGLPSGQARLAVLPFLNLTGDTTKEYLCDGMTESMISELSRLSPDRMAVVARTSAMHFKGTTESTSQIGRELNVDYLLESSLRDDGTRVRVAAQLVRTSDGSHVWTGEYERELTDVLDVQQQVSLAVAEEVKLKLAPDTNTRLRQNRDLNPDVYRDYLLGRYYWNKRDRDSLLESVKYYQRALQRDPNYAPAYAGLADAYLTLGGGYLPDKLEYDQARAAATKALELDGNLAEAYTSLAYEKFVNEWDWAGADDDYQRALTLDPNYATAHHWYAIFLAAMRRQDEAIREIHRALDLDPLSLSINYNAGFVYLQTGHVDDAILQLKKSLEIDPKSAAARGGLAVAYARKSLYDLAIQEFQRAHASRGTEYSPYMVEVAHVYALQGRKDESLRLLRSLLSQPGWGAVAPYSFAITYAALGDKDAAFRWLQRSVDDHSCTVTELNTDPSLDPLRLDARFEQIRSQFRLPANLFVTARSTHP
jgi:TolB-like protein/DNA-binding winged helix-turn-helix (wHTH) protein/Tfp pilus assembly protein PilF